VSEHPELGQSPKNGFDCSGFVRFVLNKVGLAIPEYTGQDGVRRPIRHTNEFWDTYGIPVHDECRQRGDLIFFSRRGSFPTHIGIVRDEESYIHSPGTDESKVEVRPISYETIAKRSIERQFYTRNPIGFKSPTVEIEKPTYRYHQRPI
jgi:cell wall-associated NlpC family hydrolase